MVSLEFSESDEWTESDNGMLHSLSATEYCVSSSNGSLLSLPRARRG